MPWGKRDDLICSKLKSASERLERGHEKAIQDLTDVEQLLEKIPGVLTVESHKKHCLHYLRNLLEKSSLGKKDWEKQLGIKFED